MKKSQENVYKIRHIDKTIACCLKSSKATKNIHRDILDLRESADPTLSQLYTNLLATSISFYKHIYTCIDQEEQSKFDTLSQAFLLMRHCKQEGMEWITNLSKQDSFEEIHVTTLINLYHYIYETADMLLLAIAYTYLPEKDITAFEKINDVPDEIYEAFELYEEESLSTPT